jgi:hypothetical protein
LWEALPWLRGTSDESDRAHPRWFGVTVNLLKTLPYLFGLLIIIVFVARIIQVYSYLGYAFLKIGLFSDKICTRGSYEIIVCLPEAMPPYETILGILAILLVFSLWLIKRKQQSRKV